MKVLLNCSTLVKGGALQAAVSFIRTAVNQDDDIDWHYVLSKKVFEELQKFNISFKLGSAAVIECSPARSYRTRRDLRKFERKVNPDVVFTLFGPAYVDFKAPHLCGVADGWVTHGDCMAWRTIQGPGDAIRSLGLLLYKAYMYRKADAWVTEASIAKEGLVRRLRIKSKKIAVVPNSCASHYLCSETNKSFPCSGEKVRILCMSAYYRHKNLEIIPAVAKELETLRPDLRFEFVITLPAEGDGARIVMSKARALGVSHRIINVGYVPVNQGPDLYQSCHFLFLPSVLETFSANYPEAMAMGRPIVTVDLGFAHAVCGQAALYFEPMNHVSAALAILKLCSCERTWEQLIAEGKRIFRQLPTTKDKYEMYSKCLREVSRSRDHVDFSTVLGKAEGI